MNTNTLIERIEAAGPEQQRELLEEAWNTIHEKTNRSLVVNADAQPPRILHESANVRVFAVMLDIGAFVDAALMLVPEGWSWEITQYKWWAAKVYAKGCVFSYDGHSRSISFEASTPALAILAACLKATEKRG